MLRARRPGVRDDGAEHGLGGYVHDLSSFVAGKRLGVLPQASDRDGGCRCAVCGEVVLEHSSEDRVAVVARQDVDLVGHRLGVDPLTGGGGTMLAGECGLRQWQCDGVVARRSEVRCEFVGGVAAYPFGFPPGECRRSCLDLCLSELLGKRCGLPTFLSLT